MDSETSRSPLQRFICLPATACCVLGMAKCGACNLPLAGAASTDALGQSWHQKCFRCKSCGDLLTSNYSDVNGDPYCDDCGRKVKAVSAANAESEEEARKRKIEEEKKKLAAKIAEKKRLLAQANNSDAAKEDGTVPSYPCE